MVMDHGERRNGGEGAAHMRAGVQRALAKPWRGGAAAGAAAAPPPKVYRVEPRNFRELVQRLTGAGTAAAPMGVRQAPAPAPAHAVHAAHGLREAAVAAEQQFDYASWFSAPLLSPVSMPDGFDVGRSGNGALLYDSIDRVRR